LTVSTRLGEPCGSTTAFFVESATSAAATCAGVTPGSAAGSSAAAPDTCGVAIDVPLIIA